MPKYTHIKFAGIKYFTKNIMLRQIMVLTFAFICLNHIYSQPKPDSFKLKSQQIVKKDKEASLPAISLKEGKAYVKGKVYGYNPESNSLIRVTRDHPIMNEPDVIIDKISRNGEFFMEVPILSNSTWLFVSDYYMENLLLSPGDTCCIYIDANQITDLNKFDARKRDYVDTKYIRFGGAFAQVNNDLNDLHFLVNTVGLFGFKNEYDNSDLYKEHILSTLNKSLKEFLSKNISQQTKELITINLRQQAMRSLVNSNALLENPLNKGDLSTPVVDLDYFSFLEELNINSPYSFYGRFFQDIIYECMSIEEKLMPLGELINKREMPMKALNEDAIKRQKDYLSRVLKENSGPAFDLLEVLNFTSKIRQDMSLDEWEIESLKQLKEPVYYDYIIEKNKLLSSHLKVFKEKSTASLFDATTEKDNYFENILSLNEDNVIMLTYWSMGCIPCHTANNYIEPLKVNYINKKLVFLYLTDEYFLYPAWENQSVQIQGIHYRLNKKQIEYVKSKFGMANGTPGFLVFDKKGECIFNQSGYSEYAVKDIFDTIDKELSNKRYPILIQ